MLEFLRRNKCMYSCESQIDSQFKIGWIKFTLNLIYKRRFVFKNTMSANTVNLVTFMENRMLSCNTCLDPSNILTFFNLLNILTVFVSKHVFGKKT